MMVNMCLRKIFIFILINFMVIEGVFGQVQLSPTGTDSFIGGAHSPNLRLFTNDRICNTATNGITGLWDTSKFARDYIQEAKRRGLDCDVSIAKKNIRGYSNSFLCKKATDPSGLLWSLFNYNQMTYECIAVAL